MNFEDVFTVGMRAMLPAAYVWLKSKFEDRDDWQDGYKLKWDDKNFKTIYTTERKGLWARLTGLFKSPGFDWENDPITLYEKQEELNREIEEANRNGRLYRPFTVVSSTPQDIKEGDQIRISQINGMTPNMNGDVVIGHALSAPSDDGRITVAFNGGMFNQPITSDNSPAERTIETRADGSTWLVDRLMNTEIQLPRATAVEKKPVALEDPKGRFLDV